MTHANVDWLARPARPIPLDGDRYEPLTIKAVPVPFGNGSTFRQWVSQPAAATIAALRHAMPQLSVHPHVVVWLVRAPIDIGEHALSEAAYESLRGIVQSLTRELAGDLRPLNAIVVGDDDAISLSEGLEFLSGPGGEFTAGSTLDLRPRQEGAA